MQSQTNPEMVSRKIYYEIVFSKSPCETKIADFDFVVLEEEEILTLEIAMDNFLSVEILHSMGDVSEQAFTLSIRAFPLLLYVVKQVSVVRNLHDDKNFRWKFEYVGARDYVFVIYFFQHIEFAWKKSVDEVLEDIGD